jgi:hypothetical protein
MMYDNQCSYCGKSMKSYARDKMGKLPKVYCSRKCEGDAKAELRVFDRKRFS